MFTEIRSRNFKSWKDMGNLKLAPLTGLFGSNSSGKTSILQVLLMLKQTVESPDRRRVLNTGDDRSLVDLGTLFDLFHGHDVSQSLDIGVTWKPVTDRAIKDPEEDRELYRVREIAFDASIRVEAGAPRVDRFRYDFNEQSFGMSRIDTSQKRLEYKLESPGYQAKRFQGRAWGLPEPVKCYGFPDEVSGYYQNVGFLSDIVFEFEALFGRTFYLGPLRDYPKRSYVWAGESPADVGRRGELAIPTLLAAQSRGTKVSPGYKKRHQPVQERIAYWLQQMGMIHSYTLKPIAANRKDYELRVKKTATSPAVLITDVGFGVSQVFPILVLCFCVKEGSVLLLEQPEIHLHPSVQAWLADVFIEVVDRRRLQIIVESHSEYFLRRLQRRIAEKKIDSERTALYFCRYNGSSSHIEKLDVDLFGNIRNWPSDFFGDTLGELMAMSDARASHNDS